MRALVRRWWTRPGRTPPWLRALVALGLGTVALVGIANPPSSQAGGVPTATPGLAAQGGRPNDSPNAPDKSPQPPGPGGATTTFPDSAALRSEGHSLYENGCAVCHGAQLQGIHTQGPSLVGVGAGPVNFYLSTGRMPLQDSKDEPEQAHPVYTHRQINALVAFITHVGGGPPAPAANPAAGNLGLGLKVFTENCAGCHQSVGRGGLTIGAYVPSLQSATPLQIAEAVRMGPYLMPHFDASQINQHQLDSLARYVLWTRHPDDPGGWGIYNIGPIPEGMVAWFIGLLAMVIVARLIGERTGQEAR